MVCPQRWSLPLGVKFAPRGELCPQGWTLSPGVNFVPRGEFCPQGWTLCPKECPSLRSPLGVNTLYCLEEYRGEQRISPLGDNFTPRRQSSLLVDTFAPGGQSLPLGAKLRMSLSLAQLTLTWTCLQSSPF
jgi:hypothetical protein